MRWGYRKGPRGRFEGAIFEGDLPRGWVDTPAKLVGWNPGSEIKKVVVKAEPVKVDYDDGK